MDKIEKIRLRILNSLKLTRKQQLKLTKEFWYGFLVGLVDYGIISEDQYRKLRNMVYCF